MTFWTLVLAIVVAVCIIIALPYLIVVGLWLFCLLAAIVTKLFD